MVRVAIALLYLLVLPSATHAEARFALLIGNQSYDPSVGVLKNPHNDIAVVGSALARQGFELLPPVKDAKRTAILGAVRDLVRRLNAGGSGAIGFIYYSGHGAAEKDTNVNYLIPVDAKEPGTTAFWDESLKLDDILRLLDGARSAAKFIVFDACRKETQLPTKDTTKGLAPVAEQQGMFIAYATTPGRTASDRGAGSGPYAAALAAELANPGLDHLSLFPNVKEAVYAASGGAQQPWESNGLVRRVYLTGLAKPNEPSNAAPSTPQISEAERAWAEVKDSTSQPVLETYIEQFSGTVYSAMARARLDESKKHQAAAITPQTSAQVASDHPQNGLRVCNLTSSHIGVAIAFKVKAGWRSEGWWNIAPNACEDLIRGKLVSRYLYVHAIDYDAGDDWHGLSFICTQDKQFTIVQKDASSDCEKQGYKRTGFFEVDTGTRNGWTVKLTQSGK